MLSIASKLMESCFASNITNHVVMQNLLENRRWAYRKGKSTGLPWDTSTEDVLMRTGWDSLETMYKVQLTEFVFK